MKRFVFILAAACLLTACRTKTVYVPIERKTVEIVTLKDTVVNVRLENIRDSISTPDSTSYLSNKYAYSRAEVRGGKLNHSLGMWPVDIPVEVRYIERIRVDSIPVPYEVKVFEYQTMPLRWWERSLMFTGFVAIVGLIAFLIAVKIMKQ